MNNPAHTTDCLSRSVVTTALLLGSLTLPLILVQAEAASGVVDQLLSELHDQAGSKFSLDRGALLFNQQQGRDNRSCTSCHTRDPRNRGKHHKTDKPIEPLAPSANPQRLTDRTEINKWLLRNCKWTLGRECSAQEKGDLLTWLRQQ
ncbi:MAG TPA: DUF1924 domain-containing protein [Motiliproteus sp.]